MGEGMHYVNEQSHNFRQMPSVCVCVCGSKVESSCPHVIIAPNIKQHWGGGADKIPRGTGLGWPFKWSRKALKHLKVDVGVKCRFFFRHCKGDENIWFDSLEGSLQLVFFEEEVGLAQYCLEKSGGGRSGAIR